MVDIKKFYFIKDKPKFLYRWARNIKNEVVKSVTSQPRKKLGINNKGFFRCTNCMGCWNVKMQCSKIEKYVSERDFTIRELLACDSRNCIYLIECSCPKLYIGRTTRRLKERWYEHFRGIKKGDRLHPFAIHMKDVHKSNASEIKKLIGYTFNTFYTYTFNTLEPEGLNSNFELKWFLDTSLPLFCLGVFTLLAL